MARLLEQASTHLHTAVAVGVRLRSQGPGLRRAVDQQWEHFIAEFLSQLKTRGRETNENLMASLSFSRILAKVK